jgi:hypothetical protein
VMAFTAGADPAELEALGEPWPIEVQADLLVAAAGGLSDDHGVQPVDGDVVDDEAKLDRRREDRRRRDHHQDSSIGEVPHLEPPG